MQILLQVAYKKNRYNPSKCKSTFIHLIEPYVILTTKTSVVNHVNILVLSPRKCDRNLNCIEIGWEKMPFLQHQTLTASARNIGCRIWSSVCCKDTFAIVYFIFFQLRKRFNYVNIKPSLYSVFISLIPLCCLPSQ